MDRLKQIKNYKKILLISNVLILLIFFGWVLSFNTSFFGVKVELEAQEYNALTNDAKYELVLKNYTNDQIQNINLTSESSDININSIKVFKGGEPQKDINANDNSTIKVNFTVAQNKINNIPKDIQFQYKRMNPKGGYTKEDTKLKLNTNFAKTITNSTGAKTTAPVEMGQIKDYDIDKILKTKEGSLRASNLKVDGAKDNNLANICETQEESAGSEADFCSVKFDALNPVTVTLNNTLIAGDGSKFSLALDLFPSNTSEVDGVTLGLWGDKISLKLDSSVGGVLSVPKVTVNLKVLGASSDYYTRFGIGDIDSGYKSDTLSDNTVIEQKYTGDLLKFKTLASSDKQQLVYVKDTKNLAEDDGVYDYSGGTNTDLKYDAATQELSNSGKSTNDAIQDQIYYDDKDSSEVTFEYSGTKGSAISLRATNYGFSPYEVNIKTESATGDTFYSSDGVTPIFAPKQKVKTTVEIKNILKYQKYFNIDKAFFTKNVNNAERTYYDACKEGTDYSGCQEFTLYQPNNRTGFPLITSPTAKAISGTMVEDKKNDSRIGYVYNNSEDTLTYTIEGTLGDHKENIGKVDNIQEICDNISKSCYTTSQKIIVTPFTSLKIDSHMGHDEIYVTANVIDANQPTSVEYKIDNLKTVATSYTKATCKLVTSKGQVEVEPGKMKYECSVPQVPVSDLSLDPSGADFTKYEDISLNVSYGTTDKSDIPFKVRRWEPTQNEVDLSAISSDGTLSPGEKTAKASEEIIRATNPISSAYTYDATGGELKFKEGYGAEKVTIPQNMFYKDDVKKIDNGLIELINSNNDLTDILDKLLIVYDPTNTSKIIPADLWQDDKLSIDSSKIVAPIYFWNNGTDKLYETNQIQSYFGIDADQLDKTFQANAEKGDSNVGVVSVTNTTEEDASPSQVTKFSNVVKNAYIEQFSGRTFIKSTCGTDDATTFYIDEGKCLNYDATEGATVTPTTDAAKIVKGQNDGADADLPLKNIPLSTKAYKYRTRNSVHNADYLLANVGYNKVKIKIPENYQYLKKMFGWSPKDAEYYLKRTDLSASEADAFEKSTSATISGTVNNPKDIQDQLNSGNKGKYNSYVTGSEWLKS